MKFGRTLVLVLTFVLSHLATVKAEAAWKKEGPIVTSELGSFDVLITQMSAWRVDVSLLDANENVLHKVSALERWAHFAHVPAGTYYILVETSGSDDLNVYVSFTPFRWIDSSP